MIESLYIIRNRTPASAGEYISWKTKTPQPCQRTRLRCFSLLAARERQDKFITKRAALLSPVSRHAQKENELPQSRRKAARQLPLGGSLWLPTAPCPYKASAGTVADVAHQLPVSRTPKMRRNFRNRKIASVPVKGPAFRDPKGTSRPSAAEKVSGEGKAGQPRGRGVATPARLWFLSPRRERNRTAACGRGKEETR